METVVYEPVVVVTAGVIVAVVVVAGVAMEVAPAGRPEIVTVVPVLVGVWTVVLVPAGAADDEVEAVVVVV